VVHTVADEGVRVPGAATLRSVHREHADRVTAEDGWGNRIVEPLTPHPDELVVGKSRASAFFGTTLDTYFRAAGVESLVVVGESTSGCVRASVVDAYSLGFDVVVVDGGVFDRSPLSHSMSLFDLHLKYATVVDEQTASNLLRSEEPAVLDVRMG
jgi:nicotinamidase-related amidase